MPSWILTLDCPSMPSVLALRPQVFTHFSPFAEAQLSSPTHCLGQRRPTQLLGDKGAAVWLLLGYRDDKAWHLLMLQMRRCGKVKPSGPHIHKWIINH